jgi:hypothetical protein
VGFLDRLNADYAKRYTVPAVRPSANGRRPAGPVPPGGFSFGTTWFGGPMATDVYGAKRAPSPSKLIEKYQALIYALVARKRDAVTRVPLRLYADGSRAQGGKPRSACDPIRVSRHVAGRLVRAGLVSSAAVDQIYEVRNHPILDALDRPDPYGCFTRDKLIGLMCSYQDVLGSGYLVPEGNGWDWRKTTGRTKGPPEHLWVIYPQYVFPNRPPGSPIPQSWQYFRDTLPWDSTIWFRQSISLRDAYGAAYSPAYAGDIYADQEGRFLASYDQVLGIGARPNLVVSAKDPMMAPGEDEAKRMEQTLNRKFSGPGAGGIHVDRGAWDFTPVSYPPADMAARDLAEYDRNCLAAIFGIPPTYFTTDTNLANLQAADEQMAKFAVEPMCKSIAGTLTALARTWDPRLKFLHDPVIAEDELQKAQVDKIYVDMGAVTINQLNEEKKFPAVDWGKEPLFNKNLQTWSMMQQAHEQGMQQGQQQMEIGRKTAEFELTDDPVESEEEEVRALLDRAKWLTTAIERRMAS